MLRFPTYTVNELLITTTLSSFFVAANAEEENGIVKDVFLASGIASYDIELSLASRRGKITNSKAARSQNRILP